MDKIDTIFDGFLRAIFILPKAFVIPCVFADVELNQIRYLIETSYASQLIGPSYIKRIFTGID